MELSLLKGIDRMRDTLLENTCASPRACPPTMRCSGGARGIGKSSLVKAVHREVEGLKLVEIHREDLASLPQLLAPLRAHRFILFCDDLSCEALDTSYKSLKAVLEGGIEGRPANVLFYATSKHGRWRAATVRAASPGNLSRTSPEDWDSPFRVRPSP